MDIKNDLDIISKLSELTVLSELARLSTVNDTDELFKEESVPETTENKLRTASK